MRNMSTSLWKLEVACRFVQKIVCMRICAKIQKWSRAICASIVCNFTIACVDIGTIDVFVRCAALSRPKHVSTNSFNTTSSVTEKFSHWRTNMPRVMKTPNLNRIVHLMVSSPFILTVTIINRCNWLHLKRRIFSRFQTKSGRKLA